MTSKPWDKEACEAYERKLKKENSYYFNAFYVSYYLFFYSIFYLDWLFKERNIDSYCVHC